MDHNIFNMTAKEYKKYHESFMENNHGSTPVHTFLCIFFTVQCSIFCALNIKYPITYQYLYEYMVIVLPLILAHTILSNYIYLLNFIIFTLLLKHLYTIYSKLKLRKTYIKKNYFKSNKLHSISCLRGLTYLITVFCILAVDFNIFPRHLAKTENYGYSLMDTGVGLFVLMSGLVHKNSKNNNFTMLIRSNIKFVTILIILGVARFISIKQLDYQEHVTEYGVHWNFFFTLAICKVISTVILLYTKHALFASILLLVVHEYLLIIGLEKWVFGDTLRTNIINANREGISSSLGYVTLYLFAAYLKSVLLDENNNRYTIQIKLTLFSVCFWLSCFIANFYRPASRTLANASYCLYLESVLLIVITFLYFFEVQFHSNNTDFSVPLILSAVNDNGLLYFLVANLCTGAINLSINTLFVSPIGALLILNMYMVLLVCLVICLKQNGIRI
ncbi:unnamed protein product [Diatraea saccharalis]|uniref:Phosphatidylinositol-glycan biosynthesis class W protein n=1 Tax=Diatraea saccharalis TaxID=40085 RepID=A0A9N9QVF7_9NEOP|nr:unnamed protein product [Diatraea saccharalis]